MRRPSPLARGVLLSSLSLALACGSDDSGEGADEVDTGSTDEADTETSSTDDTETGTETGSTDDTDTDSDSTGETDSTDDTDTGEALPCNGHPQLCDRPFDEVVFAATHNSHAVTSEGFSAFNANQGFPVPNQLEDGVRAFLLDTYFEDDSVVLCHGPCGLGEVSHALVLGQMVDFLEANPREVVAILYQDAVSPEQLSVDYEATGAIDLVYSHPEGEPWPTLGELIEANARLLVTAEQGGPPPDWHHHLWALAWDTPYGPTDAEDLSCELNRGDPDNDLFLVNHWVNNSFGLPSAENAEEVNAYDPLLARALECWALWDHPPNFLAVDYYERGNLMEVVDALNLGDGP